MATTADSPTPATDAALALVVPHAPYGGRFARRPAGLPHATARDAQRLNRFWHFPNAPDRGQLLTVLQRHQIVTPHQLHRLFPAGFRTLPAVLAHYRWGTRLMWDDGAQTPDPRVALFEPFLAATGLDSVRRGTVPNGRYLLHRIVPLDQLFA